MLGRVWNAIKDAVDGLKTLCVALFFILLGLAEFLELINLRPVLELFLGEDLAAKIMIFLPIVFIALRFVSNSAPRWTKRWREERHDALNRVDDPEATPKQEGGI